MRDIIFGQFIDFLVSIPVTYIILRLLFKNSILIKVGVIWVINILIVSFISEYEALKYIHPAVSFIITALATLLGLYITAKILRMPLDKAISQIKQMANGDLTIKLQKTNENNEIGRINNALFDLGEQLNKVIDEVKSNTGQLSSASSLLGSTADQMAQRTSEQAASVEEVSATMEEMAANIESNTQNAKQTEQIAILSSQRIKEVSDSSNESLTSISNIAGKIGIINDIAFQTNILALNAAVEAARAGEQGKGFAVVAAEVRKLAERSKIAADEIVSLANNSVKVTQNAGALLFEIIPDIERTASLVQEITASSNEQNNGADQVNNAMQQLNNVTQGNAAVAEQISGNSVELSNQAQQLSQVISYFKTNSGNQYKSTRLTSPEATLPKKQVVASPKVVQKPVTKQKMVEFKPELAPKSKVEQPKPKPSISKPAEVKSQAKKGAATPKPKPKPPITPKKSPPSSGINLNLNSKISDDDFESF